MKHIQALHAAISRRDWHAVEVAANALRDMEGEQISGETFQQDPRPIPIIGAQTMIPEMKALICLYVAFVSIAFIMAGIASGVFS